MSSHTLYYWAFAGRAQPIRDAFSLGKVPFVNDTSKDFNEWKTNGELPLGQWPALDVDGVRYVESNALLVYAGKKAGLINTENALELLQTMELLEVAEDFFTALSPSMRLPAGEEKNAVRKVFAEGPLRRIGALLEKRLKANAHNSHFFVGKTLTIADLKVLSIYESVSSGRLDGIPKTAFDEFPLFTANAQAVAAIVAPLRAAAAAAAAAATTK